MKMGFDESGNIVHSNLLLKVQKMKFLEEIQCGKLYMKPLYFHRINEREGAGDPTEGILADFDDALLEIDGITIADVKNCKLYVLGDRPIFCCFSVEFERISEREYTCTVDKKLLAEFTDDTDDYGIIIIKRDSLRQRISEALEAQSLSGFFDDVDYTDEKQLYNGDDLYKTAFRKRTKFKHQHECRLLVNKSIEDHFILDVGDLRDISMIIPITDINKDITVKVCMNE